jgi:anti-sigma B factor antagonist
VGEDDQLELKSEVSGGITVYRIAGKLDALSESDLGTAINSTIAQGNTKVIFDLSGVTYVSSAGLRRILSAAKQAAAAKGGVAVFGLQPAVNKVFELSGLQGIIPIVSDEAQARSRLGA